jgi:hypothetical protein
MEPSDCAGYRTGRIGEYMYGKEKPPCGFTTNPRFYDPDVVRDFHGNAVIIAGPVGKVDGCSGKPLTIAGNTAIGLPGMPLNPFGWAEVERAYEEFDVACRAHDYAYDLIRYAWNYDGFKYRINGRSDLVRDRQEADRQMREISTGVCNDASWVTFFDVWDKTVCWKLREIMYAGLVFWTATQPGGIP